MGRCTTENSVATRSANEYACIVRRSRIDRSKWFCLFPDLPGCIAWAGQKELVLQAGTQAAELWLVRAAEMGVSVPGSDALLECLGVVKIRTSLTLHQRLVVASDRNGTTLTALVQYLIDLYLQRRMTCADVSAVTALQQLRSGSIERVKQVLRSPRKDRSSSGVWIQRLSPATHSVLQGIARHEGISMNTFLVCVLSEQVAILDVYDATASWITLNSC